MINVDYITNFILESVSNPKTFEVNSSGWKKFYKKLLITCETETSDLFNPIKSNKCEYVISINTNNDILFYPSIDFSDKITSIKWK